MDYSDAQIEVAILASVERQANRTAAALARVYSLMKRIETKKGKTHAKTLRNPPPCAEVAAP